MPTPRPSSARAWSAWRIKWASDAADQAIANVEFLKAGSEYLKGKCDKYDLKYFVNATDHWQTVDAVVQFLRP